MQITCEVYKSIKQTELYLYVNKDDGLDRVPEALLEKFKSPEFCFDFELTPEKKLIREDSVVVIKNIIDQGYHLQMPPVHLGQIGRTEKK